MSHAIHTLFDPEKSVNRVIEKVISYGVAQEDRLRREINEYVVTQHIDDQFFELLNNMQAAMEGGGDYEIGVWVSGFYGSGKSSITKYLGFALDENCVIDGKRFLEHLKDRLINPQTAALLSTVAKRFPAAVVMLDLASEMLAGATMEDVSSVLYFKVLQWAGYSRNLKVAAFEQMVEKDKRRAELDAHIHERMPGSTWDDLRDNPLIVDGLMPSVAHAMYPGFFPTPSSFNTNTEGFLMTEDQRVQEMIEVVRKKSGKENVLFVIDEVGQYVASRSNLILNLDGLAKNIKRIGDGKVWLIATAQQTLTEDNPRAALNSPELYKLNDRFPIKLDLASSDIREICYRRLLEKTTAGEATLHRLFDQHGQALRHYTKLQDAKHYDSNFSKESFTRLYPFLPSLFEVLLMLLGTLAKSTGGLGLRPAIKVVQDVLRGDGSRNSLADQTMGTLVTSVTLYDELEKEIKHSFPSIFQAIDFVKLRFEASSMEVKAAKTIGLLQILGTLPSTLQNIAALLHPSITSPSLLEEVKQAVEVMVKDKLIPLGEKDGQLAFLSEKLRDIAREREEFIPRANDIRRTVQQALGEVMNPVPKVAVSESLMVTPGIRVQSAGTSTSLSGEGNAIQILLEGVEDKQYEATKAHLVVESRSRTAQNAISLIFVAPTEVEDYARDILRAEEVANKYRNDLDPDVKQFCTSQTNIAARKRRELQAKLKHALQAGSYIFRGQVSAISAIHPELIDSIRRFMESVAQQVYDRISEAPIRVQTDVAEQFLRAHSLNSVTKKIDPLEFVQIVNRRHVIRADHKALVSVKDYIERSGVVEGKRLLDFFSEPPYGWSPDTVRYIVAALLRAGEIKLKVSGQTVQSTGQKAIDALKSTPAFRPVGVSMVTDKPTPETLARAAERLSRLSGDLVIPLPEDISKEAIKVFKRIQERGGTLESKLVQWKLNGADRVRSLRDQVTTALDTDASDAAQRFGGEESALFDDIAWLHAVDNAFQNGLQAVLEALQPYESEASALPDVGIPGDIRKAMQEPLQAVERLRKHSAFHERRADFQTALSELEAHVRNGVALLMAQQASTVKNYEAELSALARANPALSNRLQEANSRLEAILEPIPETLAGLKQVLSRDFKISYTFNALKEQFKAVPEPRPEPEPKHEAPLPTTTTTASTHVEDAPQSQPSEQPRREPMRRTLRTPRTLNSLAQIDELIRNLQRIREEATTSSASHIVLELFDS